MEGGLFPEAQSMQGLWYKELVPVLKGQMALAEAVELLKLRTRHFAKRQLTWFKHDARVQWLPGQSLSSMVERICREAEENEKPAPFLSL